MLQPAALAAAAAEDAEPRFRILRDDGRRQALKLEPFWWEQIEALARSAGLSPSDFVFRLLDDLPADENKTAYLRRCVGLALYYEAQRYRAGAGASLKLLARSSPEPALIVSEAGLVEIGPAALDALERGGLRQATLTAASIAVRPTAAGELFRALRAARSGGAEHDLSIRIDGALRRARVQATLFIDADPLGAGAPDWAFCFLSA